MNYLESIQVLINSADAGERRAAASMLSQCSESESVAALIHALSDTSRSVRVTAASSLERLGNPEVIRQLGMVLHSRLVCQRNTAAEILQQLGQRSVWVLEELSHDPDHDVRKFAIDILGLIPDNRLDHVIVNCLSDSDANVRVAAVEALGTMHSAQSVSSLVETFHHYPDTQISVLEALGKIGGEESEEFLYHCLETALQQPQRETLGIHTMIEALALCGSPLSFDSLCTLLYDRDEEIQKTTLYALIRIAQRLGFDLTDFRPQLSQLVALLQGRNNDQCLAAITVLSSFPESEIVRTLLCVAGSDQLRNQALITALEQRPDCINECLPLLNSALATLQPDQLYVVLTVLRRRYSKDFEPDAIMADLVFERVFVLRSELRNELSVIAEDLLMALDPVRTMDSFAETH